MHVSAYPDLSTNALASALELSPASARAALGKLQEDGRVTYRLDECKDPPGKHWSVIR
ncbi:hypothetical protein MF271_05040 [Deinococcus sp. KNUC1210]|uniref:hypothetical protein n=1 Tax=Deinococcus sp. KNUC1210 TaxID=2917691 RepID=UPI001EF1127D|nr:hypothetical protein [Deinococcus sp. KNUC1210]ULH16001.1 hypothetical protein MF271_05040 [Deinococcus sp. KNUC1210]